MIFLRLPLMLLRLIVQSIFLAAGQIRTNKARSILTCLGIIIGVGSVTAVIAALTGLKTKVLNDFESIGTNKIFIIPMRPGEDPAERQRSWMSLRLVPEQFEGLLTHCPSVSRLTRITAMGALVTYRRQSVDDASIYGIEPAWHEIENRAVTQGRPFSLIDNDLARPVCLVTEKVQDKLQLPKECAGQCIMIGNRSYQVIGVVEARAESSMFGGRGSGSEVFIPFQTLSRSLDRNGQMWAIATSASPGQSDDAVAEIKFFLRQTRHRKPTQNDDFRLEVVKQYLQKFEEVSIVITMVASGIVGISLIVGGVGIMNIMLVSVSERTREIGLRKAVGARPSAILLQFLVEAVMLCMFGGLLGLAAGQGLTEVLKAVPAMGLSTAYIPMWAVGLSFGFAATVGVTFGMFPAIKAARLDPIEALRHE